MSARAIRAMRGSNEALLRGGETEESSDEDSSEQEETAKSSAFAAMMDSSDEEEESSSSEEEQQHQPEPSGETKTGVGKEETMKPEDGINNETEQETEEDIDALLEEFAEHDEKQIEEEIEEQGAAYFGFVMEGLDPRDLDVDYSMRNSLVGVTDGATTSAPRHSRGSRSSPLFGPPRDGWPRPPHYVGGGLGMTSYDKDPRELPWPYNFNEASRGKKDVNEDTEEHAIDERFLEESGVSDLRKWFTFILSDSYGRDFQDYEFIQQTGDLNALVMFVAHHPYVTDALLQLTSVLYQTNHSQEGLSLLRRCIWVYESAALMSFTRNLNGDAFMDIDQPENATFFKSLFKLMHVSRIAGLPRTSMSIARFVLSLDPLRDPMRMLAVLDAYSLSANTRQIDRWLVDFVDNNRISICVRKDDSLNETYAACDLLKMPNWAYSYALALYRLLQVDSEMQDKADAALRRAIHQFPDVVGRLLQALEVDTAGRSFRRDWVTVLDFATERSKLSRRQFASTCDDTPEDVAPTLKACDVLIKIYAEQASKQWADDDVLQWVYDTLSEIAQEEAPADLCVPHRAIMRYVDCNPSDFENRVQLFPQDANILDAGMVAHAMAVNPNRPRFLRNMPRGMDGAAAQRHAQAAGLAGPPTQMIDPDWPVLEVFWRSFLPWNHVEGVPPPPRG